jgi:hypothetical protein
MEVDSNTWVSWCAQRGRYHRSAARGTGILGWEERNGHSSSSPTRDDSVKTIRLVSLVVATPTRRRWPDRLGLVPGGPDRDRDTKRLVLTKGACVDENPSGWLTELKAGRNL